MYIEYNYSLHYLVFLVTCTDNALSCMDINNLYQVSQRNTFFSAERI